MPPEMSRMSAVASDGNNAPTTATPTNRIKPITPKAIDAPEKLPPQSNLNRDTNLQKPLAPVSGQLRFRVTGVSAMIENQPADVSIEVYNPTGYPIGPVEVNVKVPVELTITRFNRDAWLDAERRIIAFEIDRLEPGTVPKD